MTTDEQRMRERFESDCLHIDEGQLARTKAGDYATEWVHGTWIGYAIAYKARDAEVQQLRTENQVMRAALFRITQLEVNHRKEACKWGLVNEEVLSMWGMAYSMAAEIAWQALHEVSNG